MESVAPPELALQDDRIGYHGPEIEVESVLVLMDYIYGVPVDGYDLLVLHHPPLIEPPLPYFVAHSNWDIADGGASDALADALGVDVESSLDDETGMGRICHADIPMDELLKRASTINPDTLRVVNPSNYVNRIAVIPGFGLSQDTLIKMAWSKGVSAYLSGDLTHRCAVLARNMDMTLIDAGHHSTEMPGLLRLRDIIEDQGLNADIHDSGTPWVEYSI